MNLKILGSSSKGNCYILGNETECILIECGLKLDEIKKGLDFNILNVKACVVSHEHDDHAKAIKPILQSGIPVYCSNGTASALKIGQEQFERISHGKSRKVGNWTFKAFSVEHDVKEPLGFIIEHSEIGSLLFVTDTYILKHDLSAFSFDTIMIEANYCETITDKIRAAKGDDFVNRRRINQHMSFQTAVVTLERLNLSNTNNIVLLHLSDGLTDEKRFERDIVKQFGISATCAAPGVNINLNGY